MKNRSDLTTALSTVDALLPTEIYSYLYDYSAVERPEVAVDVGTAHGACSIALALGAKTVGHPTKIWAIDPLQGSRQIPSSREKFGDVSKNAKIVQGNFANAGVADAITLFVGTDEKFSLSKSLRSQIQCLILDADGRIDRSLLLFRSSMSDGALIMIDDIDGRPHAIRNGGKSLIDLKHVIAKKLTLALVDEGFLSIEKEFDKTVFCRALNPAKWDAETLNLIALEAYRELVFTTFSPLRLMAELVVKTWRSHSART